MTHAIVLSGGGSLGSFQIGALKYLAEKNRKPKLYYGVSVGAINAAALSMYSDYAQGVLEVEKFWLTIENSGVKKSWPLGFLQGWFKKGLYNPQPLKDLINNNFDNITSIATGNRLGVGVVSLQTGNFEIINAQHEHINDAILASAITPMFLSPVEIEKQLYLDGGTRHTVPIQDAINAGATSVDVVVTASSSINPATNLKNLYDVGMRVIGIMSNQMTNSDVELAIRRNPNIDIKIIRPDTQLEGDTLDFSRATILKNIELGYNAAKRVIG
jgi:NTE family protein